MVRWICSAKLCEEVPMSDVRTRMVILSIKDVIRYNRLQCMDEEIWPRKILNFEVNGSYSWDHPKENALTALEVTLINCDYQLLWF